MRNQNGNPAVQGGVSCNPSQSRSQDLDSNIKQEQQATRDEIYIFLPGIDDTEYRLRAKLRTMRNCSAACIAKTDSETARALAWQCSDYATAYIYAGTDNDWLEEIIGFCQRLMAVAMQAEEIDAAWDGGAL